MKNNTATVKYTYEDAVGLLTSSGKFRINQGLERTENILSLLGNPQDKLRCIHVAGTNGKGSVCSALTSVLQCSGKKTGLYTSPHIFKYTERIQINSNPIEDDVFTRYVFEISDLAERNNIDLTEFEILTAVMFKYFADNNVEIVVLETGLGGRLDATNVIKSNICSIITHIDYDHTERLGDTLEKIASEKAGIIKPDCPCIVCEDMKAFHVVKNSVIIPAQADIPANVSDAFSLKGECQKQNLALVWTALKTRFPEIGENIIIEGLKKVKHPCRFQYIKEKNLIIDGAHNPNGIDSLFKSIYKNYPKPKKRIIFGCLSNKDYKKMLNIICSYNPEKIYFYKFTHNASADFEKLQGACKINAEKLITADQINFNDGYLNVICGSFYMLPELCELFKLKIS